MNMGNDRSHSARGAARESASPPAELRAPGPQILGSHRARAAVLAPLPRGRVGSTPAPLSRHARRGAAGPIQRAFDELALGDAPVIASPSLLAAGWGDLG